MLVGIHQLHYLPWLRYFEKIARCDVFIVLDNIQFNKNGWQNRNKIKTDQGDLMLTVPVVAKSGQRLDEVRVQNSVKWGRKHWRTIEQHYRNAPFYEFLSETLENIYSVQWDSLNSLNRHMLNLYIDLMGIETRIAYSSELAVPGEATERLVNLIKGVGGTEYYSGSYALDVYLDADMLKEAGIGLRLQEWIAPQYPQMYGTFIADLSIVDLLMNCGPDSLNLIMDERNDTA